MASSSTISKNHGGSRNGNDVVLDLETRAKKGDHQALRLWLRLLTCTVRIENKIRRRLRRDFNTTLPRFDLMAQLERSAGGLRMSELSKRLMVSGGNVTGITDQLEREGLVARTACPGDRRAFTVKLTETGLKRFREMAARHELWIVELLGGLNRDETETMITELGKVKNHINRSVSITRRPNQSLHARGTR
jgi:DNA-binding MarR family transcriptional regulator